MQEETIVGRKEALGPKTIPVAQEKVFLQVRAVNAETHFAEVMETGKATLQVRIDSGISLVDSKSNLERIN